MLPEDALLYLTLSNGDGITGMTLMERPPTGVTAKDGFKVEETLVCFDQELSN